MAFTTTFFFVLSIIWFHFSFGVFCCVSFCICRSLHSFLDNKLASTFIRPSPNYIHETNKNHVFYDNVCQFFFSSLFYFVYLSFRIFIFIIFLRDNMPGEAMQLIEKLLNELNMKFVDLANLCEKCQHTHKITQHTHTHTAFKSRGQFVIGLFILKMIIQLFTPRSDLEPTIRVCRFVTWFQ